MVAKRPSSDSLSAIRPLLWTVPQPAVHTIRPRVAVGSVPACLPSASAAVICARSRPCLQECEREFATKPLLCNQTNAPILGLFQVSQFFSPHPQHPLIRNFFKVPVRLTSSKQRKKPCSASKSTKLVTFAKSQKYKMWNWP